MALVAAWLLDEGSGTTAAEYGGTTALDLLLSNVSLGASGIDFSAAANDDARIDSANNADIKVSASFTLAMRITTDSSSVSYQQFFHSTDSATEYSGYNLLTTSGGILEFMYSDNGGVGSGDRRSFRAITLSTSTTYDIVVVVTDVSGSATGVTVYVDTVDETGATSGSGGAMVHTTDDTTVGNWDLYGTSRNSDHIVRYIALYDHAFSTTEVSDIASDYEAFITGGAGTTITVANDTISIAGQAASALTNALPAPDNDALLISGQSLTLALDTPVNPTFDTLVITGQIASATTQSIQVPLSGSVTIAGQPVVIELNLPIQPATASLSILGNTVQLDLNIDVTQGSLNIAGDTVTVVTAGNAVLLPDTATLVLTGNNVTAEVTVIADVGAGSISFVGQNVNLALTTEIVIDEATFDISGQTVTVTAIFAVVSGKKQLIGQLISSPISSLFKRLV